MYGEEHRQGLCRLAPVSAMYAYNDFLNNNEDAQATISCLDCG